MNDYSPYSSVTQMQQDIDWLSLEQRADARPDVFVFQAVHSGDPSQPSAPAPPPTLVYRQIHTSANYYKYSFFPFAASMWALLPGSLKL